MSHSDRSHLHQQFAQRLRDTLIANGYVSTRSPSGVHMQKFADMMGHSLQICRKYLRGQAIPESQKLLAIASQLGVSPGWLLFGDCHGQHANETNKITINKDILHYLYHHISALYQPQTSNADLRSNFFIELTQDVSRISDDLEQSKKIIDLALFSAKQFVE